MKKAIYKIENKINHKIYIGQSINPQKRFEQHIYKNEKYNSLIHKAIVKYGKDNFDFSILGWFEDYNEKEQYFIQYYRSKVPYGYNIVNGGNEPPHYSGENNNFAKISNEVANNIKKQLQDWRIPRKTIVSNNKATNDIIRHINEGESWYDSSLIYPLRPQEKILNAYRAKYIQWKCCTSDIPLNQLGAKVGWGKSSAKMINQGHNHFDERLKYPIRANKEYNKQILSQETCIDYLHFEE